MYKLIEFPLTKLLNSTTPVVPANSEPSCASEISIPSLLMLIVPSTTAPTKSSEIFDISSLIITDFSPALKLISDTFAIALDLSPETFPLNKTSLSLAIIFNAKVFTFAIAPPRLLSPVAILFINVESIIFTIVPSLYIAPPPA